MDSKGWDERYASTELVWTAGPNPWVEQHTADLPPGRALDLGAGEGRHSLWLAARGWAVTAIDFSAVGLERLHRLAAAREDVDPASLTTVQADLAHYEPDPGAYDLVVIAYMHLEQPVRRAMVHRAVAGLTPDGTLLLIGHDRASAGRGVGGPPDPTLLWTLDELTADLTDTEAEITVAEQPTRIVTTEDGPREAVDTAVLARRA